MTLLELSPLANLINTGTDSPDTSRALVVFNLAEQPITGVAIFRSSMSWLRTEPLPPILVMENDGAAVPVAVIDMAEAADNKGRADRRQLTFTLCFAVQDVPANGWRTYIASYCETPSPPLQNIVVSSSLVVVETLRHGGDLSPVGNF